MLGELPEKLARRVKVAVSPTENTPELTDFVMDRSEPARTLVVVEARLLPGIGSPGLDEFTSPVTGKLDPGAAVIRPLITMVLVPLTAIGPAMVQRYRPADKVQFAGTDIAPRPVGGVISTVAVVAVDGPRFVAVKV